MGSEERQRRAFQLREQAMNRLQARRGKLTDIPADKIEELFHELEVHQVELEVQNDELRRTETALADALERYQDLYDRAPVSYLTLKDDGTISQANQAAAQLCGRERDEMEGMSLIEIVPLGDQSIAHRLLSNATSTGVPMGGEFRIERRSGVRRWVHVEISRLARREAAGLRVMMIDITARVAADQALRESEARFRLASDAGATLVYEMDALGRGELIMHGVERVTGYPPPNVLRSAWWITLIHPDDRGDYRKHLIDLDKEDAASSITYRVHRKDGEWIIVEDHAQVPKDPTELGLRIVGTIVDITERRHAEEALRDANRRKDEFLATLAHELRNPLAPIRNAVGLLRLNGPTAPDLRWAREVIERQTEQMTRLVDDLLDVSRITRGKIDLRKERVELRQAIGDAVEAIGPLIEEAGHELSVDVPPQPIIVDADSVRLTQILLNLLSNAVKFTPPRGTIELAAHIEKGYAIIRVTDSGIGIAPHMLEHVFDMFAQGEHSVERTHSGLGIGLTLVKRLVELHDGTIEARSAGPGRGSEFAVHLPVAAPLAEPEARVAQTVAEPAANTTPHRILVVDDNRDSADSMARYLRLSGNDVHTAHDGLAALDRLDEVEPDVVLLDIGLPGRNGYDVAREVRERRGENILLIAMTGWGQEEDRRRAREAGFDHHLTKPVDLERLTQLLAAAG